jgi:hypothetical protein
MCWVCPSPAWGRLEEVGPRPALSPARQVTDGPGEGIFSHPLGGDSQPPTFSELLTSGSFILSLRLPTGSAILWLPCAVPHHTRGNLLKSVSGHEVILASKRGQGGFAA